MEEVIQPITPRWKGCWSKCWESETCFEDVSNVTKENVTQWMNDLVHYCPQRLISKQLVPPTSALILQVRCGWENQSPSSYRAFWSSCQNKNGPLVPVHISSFTFRTMYIDWLKFDWWMVKEVSLESDMFRRYVIRNPEHLTWSSTRRLDESWG